MGSLGSTRRRLLAMVLSEEVRVAREKMGGDDFPPTVVGRGQRHYIRDPPEVNYDFAIEKGGSPLHHPPGLGGRKNIPARRV